MDLFNNFNLNYDGLASQPIFIIIIQLHRSCSNPFQLKIYIRISIRLPVVME